LILAIADVITLKHVHCERCNTCEGMKFKNLKVAYCAHRIKYLFSEGRRGGEGKIFNS